MLSGWTSYGLKSQQTYCFEYGSLTFQAVSMQKCLFILRNLNYFIMSIKAFFSTVQSFLLDNSQAFP